jgi:undecaprenyl-diphosphatase
LDYVYATLLGIVQGLTEFLPVSSSAHLILAREFFGWDAQGLGLAFDVATHVGTLAAILYYFRGELWPLAAAGPRALIGGGGERGHIVRLVISGTIPIVMVGLLADLDWLERLREPAVCAATLTFGAILMTVAERARATSRGDRDITTGEAFAIGVGQAAALVPGMSRSGTTISIAMLMGIRREAAARFTFLMSIPAVMAAAAREAVALRGVTLDASAMTMFAVGILAAGVVGYLTVKYLIRYLAHNSLDVFVYYRFALAGAVVMWLVARS